MIELLVARRTGYWEKIELVKVYSNSNSNGKEMTKIELFHLLILTSSLIIFFALKFIIGKYRKAISFQIKWLVITIGFLTPIICGQILAPSVAMEFRNRLQEYENCHKCESREFVQKEYHDSNGLSVIFGCFVSWALFNVIENKNSRYCKSKL